MLFRSLNCLPNGVSIINEDYRVQFENAWQQDRFGNNIGQLCYKVYRNRELPCQNCLIKESIEHNDTEWSEIKKSDGRYYQLVAMRMGKFNGKVSGLKVIVDITERKITDEKIKKLSRELRKSNKRLAHLALIDSHTGLYNHRYLKKIIGVELSRAKRHAYPFSVMMLDIDYFKSINDAYGHQFGDLVLRQLARQFKQSMRQHDVVIRFGGEEFIIILPRTDKLNGTIIAQKLLGAVKSFRFGTTQNTVKIKLSAGIVSYPENKVVKGIDLVNLADQLLNKAKENGGGRVYASIDANDEKEVFLEEIGRAHV